MIQIDAQILRTGAGLHHSEESRSRPLSTMPFQMTEQPLGDVLYLIHRKSWWLLTLTGMIWGSDKFWTEIVSTTLMVLDKSGHLHCYEVFPDPPLTIPSNTVSRPASIKIESDSEVVVNSPISHHGRNQVVCGRMHDHAERETDIELQPVMSFSSLRSAPITTPIISPTSINAGDTLSKTQSNTSHNSTTINASLSNSSPSCSSSHPTYSCSVSSSNSPISFDPLITITLSSFTKMVLCRIFYCLIRLLILGSIILIIMTLIAIIFFVSGNYDHAYIIFYLTMLIQSITTIITTYFMIKRLQQTIPQYCLSVIPQTIPICISFFILTIALEIVTLIRLNIYSFFLGFSNYTLLACLMFILMDIFSSMKLIDELIDRVDYQCELTPIGKKKNRLSLTLTAETPLLEEEIVSLEEYEEIRQEIQQRVQDSWYTNTFTVTVATLNVVNLIIGGFTYLRNTDGVDISEIVIQLSKEIIFLLIIFCYCAELNAKVVCFNEKLGRYLTWHKKELFVWHYACLNPISFELGGYVVTWYRIGLQLLSISISVMLGFVRAFLMGH